MLLAVVGTLLLASPASAAYFPKGEASWKSIPGAVQYNLYYKEKGDKIYTHAVGGLPSTLTSYTIRSLKNYVKYVYNVASVNSSGVEFSWTGEKWLPKSK